MKKVLLLSPPDKSENLIKSLLKKSGFEDVETAKAVKDAEKKALLRKRYDLIVINSPLPDGSGEDFALDAVRESICQVVFLSEEERERLFNGGVFVIRKPVDAGEFQSTLKMAAVSFNRMKMLYAKNTRLMRRMEEIKLINRAKAILIKTFGMSEDEAHRYIERQAMDLRKTKIYIAERILSTYEM